MSDSSMKAVAVVPSKKELRLVDHPIPQLSDGNQIKVQTLDVGICGTDREICTFVYGSPPEGDDYLVLGHESLGRVVEVGDNVTRLKVGDLVVPSVRRPCSDPNCNPCRNDKQDYCINGQFTERGIKEVHGFMTEFYVDDEKYFTHVPEDLRELAVMAEPLTIAEKGLAQAYAVQQRLPWASTEPGKPKGHGLRAVVLGAGPIGILGAMKCVVEGFDTYVYSRSKAPNPKADLVEQIGAKYFSKYDISPQELAEEVGNIDLVYEAVGGSEVAFDVLQVLGTNGIFVFTGIPAPETRLEIDSDILMRRIVLENLAIVGTVNADRQAFEDAIADLAEFKKRWPETIKGVISGRFSVDDHEKLLVGKSQGIKNVIAFS
ncbi:MAG: glucose 1-dehydrogenase [Limisphaerales bacterium]